MKPTAQKILLGLALAITVAAAFWPGADDDAVVAVRSGKEAAARPHATDNTTIAAVRPVPAVKSGQDASAAAGQGPVQDLFPAQTWTPPPPPPSAQESKPVAPPLPFTFGGRYVEGGKTLVFLLEGERVHSVRVGDTIDGAYRIDAIEAAAVQLTYLPLNTRQSLPTGSPNPQ